MGVGVDGSGCGWEWVWMGVGVDGSKILNHKMCSLCVALQNTCFGMLFRAECDHWHNTQNMVSRIDTIVKASLVPRPSRTCEEGLVF